jgi:hypothetical protein
MTTRRNFLMGAAALAATGGQAFAQRHLPLGLQLYTVRADLAKDYEGTIKLVKAAGIRQVQANLTQSGKNSADQRKLYDSLGLTQHARGDHRRSQERRHQEHHLFFPALSH